MATEETSASSDEAQSPNLAGFEVPLNYLRRAHVFLLNYDQLEADPVMRSFVLAAAIHAADSAKEDLDRMVENPMFGKHIKKRVGNLPRRNLIERIRNQDVHGTPIPVSLPGQAANLLVTGSVRPMVMKSAGPEIQMRLQGAKPQFRFYPNQPGKAKVEMGDSVSYHLKDGRHFACDFSDGNKVVDISVAAKEFGAAAMQLIRDMAALSYEDQMMAWAENVNLTDADPPEAG